MPLPGGATDKYGNRFEGRWTAFCMAQILDENACSIRLEPPGAEDKGFEFWLRKKERIEYHQVKRQKSRSGSWTLRNLSEVGILHNFLRKLLENSNNYCVFISTQSAYELDDLSDKARRSACFGEFKTKLLESEEHSSKFALLCQIWDNRLSKEEAFELLKRIKIESISEDTLQTAVANSIKPLIVGDPLAVAEILANLALDEIHKELSAHDIWQRLENRGLKRRIWNKDPHVLSKFYSCTTRNLPPYYDATIAGKWIERDESQIVLKKLRSSDSKRAVLISGEAGVGKSCIIKQVVETLQKENLSLLMFRADRLNATQLPEEVGAQLGLPDSPAIVLKAVAQERACVLTIDQLDSVSETSGRNPDFFYCIYEIIKQALGYPNMRILLSCRKFDLDNDHRLRNLQGNQGIAEIVQIRPLSPEIVKNFILNDLNLDVNRLSKKQIDLLSIPLHLSLLAEISKDSEIDAINFKTTKDLYDKFWDRKGKVLRQRLENSSRWTEVVFSLSDYMSEHQTLIAPASILDKFGTLPEAMASEHILIKDGNRYGFFHQGFFDYAFSRNFCAQGRKLIPFLKNDEQHLFRRAQVRQILLQERTDDPARYIADLELMLNDSKIRFHLKEIVFALLSELSDPTNEEWRIIAPFLNNSADPRSREVRYILVKSVCWINLLKSEGQLVKWLADVNEDNINLAITLLSRIQKDLPEVVIDLIKPYIDKSETWNRRFYQIYKTCKIDSSERFFELALHLMDKGILDEINELDPLDGHFWYAQKDFLKDNPEWTCEFLGHYFNRKHIMSLIGGQPNPFDIEKRYIPDHVRDEKIANSIKESAETSPEVFIHELLPFILRVIGFNAYRDDRKTNLPLYDRVWRYRYYYDRFGIYIYECILYSMESAMTLLAKTKPDSFKTLTRELGDLEFETIHYLLIRGYAANGMQFVDDAVKYLIKFPICLETGYYEDPFKAATELLEAITPYCSEEQLAKIENVIVGNYPNIEDHEKAQFELYNGINSSRRSESVNSRLKELAKKFGQSLEEPPRTFGGGLVISPISEKDADEMSEEDWLKAISVHNLEEHSFPLDGTNPVGGALELSRVLEKQVKRNPQRFVSLVQKFPADSNIHYFDAILRGIVNTDLDVDSVLDVCRYCHNLQNKPCGRWICDAIAKIAKSNLPTEALDIVAWYATKDPDPEYETWRPEGPNKTIYYGGDIINAGLNSVRGRAAEAMASLVFYDKARVTYLKTAIEKLVADSSIEVRSWVALMLIYIFIHDEDHAVKLFLDLCNTEDILLSTHHVENFLSYALRNRFSLLGPILKRMMISPEVEVVKAGARRICIASFDIEESRQMMESCISGTENQRFGAAEVFSSNIKTFPEFCTSKLIKLFYDDNKHVREQAASCFRQLIGEDLRKFRDLIEAFIESPSFDTEVEDLIWALNKTNAMLPELTYRICKKFIDSTIIVNNRNFGLEMDISQLIIRLYSQDKESTMRKKCLDLIDIMIENDVYRIDKELFNYER